MFINETVSHHWTEDYMRKISVFYSHFGLGLCSRAAFLYHLLKRQRWLRTQERCLKNFKPSHFCRQLLLREQPSLSFLFTFNFVRHPTNRQDRNKNLLISGDTAGKGLKLSVWFCLTVLCVVGETVAGFICRDELTCKSLGSRKLSCVLLLVSGTFCFVVFVCWSFMLNPLDQPAPPIQTVAADPPARGFSSASLTHSCVICLSTL